MGETIQINRAPVLALWATVVAERLGYSRDEALSLGKAVTGLNAQSKGRRLGIYEKKEETEEETKKKEQEKPAELVELMGRKIPATKTTDGIRATADGREVSPTSAERYLETKFGEHLDDARTAMEKLAKSLEPRVLAARAYALYERFRPTIPEGVRGWGAKGKLDLGLVRHLAGTARGASFDGR